MIVNVDAAWLSNASAPSPLTAPEAENSPIKISWMADAAEAHVTFGVHAAVDVAIPHAIATWQTAAVPTFVPVLVHDVTLLDVSVNVGATDVLVAHKDAATTTCPAVTLLPNACDVPVVPTTVFVFDSGVCDEAQAIQRTI